VTGNCIWVGPSPAPGVVTEVGTPLGAKGPARPPRIPPPGRLNDRVPPPAPGGVPSRELPAPGDETKSEPAPPGSAGPLASTVAACPKARPASPQKANTTTKPRRRRILPIAPDALIRSKEGEAPRVFHTVPSPRCMCGALAGSLRSPDSPAAQQS